MLDTPAHAVGVERGRAEIPGRAGGRRGVPVTEVAERYGVSRQSVHTWLLRYRQEGIAGLEDRSHQVHYHPWRIPGEVEEAICELRRGHPKWGPRRLVFEMERRGHGRVTRSTVYRTLVRNGLIEPKSRRRSRKDYRRWERGGADGAVAAGRDRQRVPHQRHRGEDRDRSR